MCYVVNFYDSQLNLSNSQFSILVHADSPNEALRQAKSILDSVFWAKCDNVILHYPDDFVDADDDG